VGDIRAVRDMKKSTQKPSRIGELIISNSTGVTTTRGTSFFHLFPLKYHHHHHHNNNNNSGYEIGYPTFGSALLNSGRDIVYSCSWPAYLGSNETEKKKTFEAMIQGGCNLWRNWDDIDNKWSSVLSIIDHWGDYCEDLKPYAGPGHWHDMDMILVGDNHYNFTMNEDQSRTQMTIWSIMASPLIMSNDLRTIEDRYRDILLNPEVIAIDQDPLGEMGLRLSDKAAPGGEIWARNLSDGSMAIALFNRGATPPSPSSMKISFELTDLGYPASEWDSASVRDLWLREDAGVITKSHQREELVEPMGVKFFKLSKN
jgi:alpha-N-acetylgalactosaminidase